MNAYFAYGTTQRGFTHHRRLAALLGEPVGRHRTAAPHAVVVPHRAACSNPGCEYVHRMALLVPGFAPLAGGDARTVFAYLAAGADRWRALVHASRADALPMYPPELAAAEERKPCCLRSPGHVPPHDVIDPLATGGGA